MQDRPQANRPRKLDDRGEASPRIQYGAGSDCLGLQTSPRKGYARWTLRLLAGKVRGVGADALHVPRRGCASVSKKRPQVPWQKKEWCIPKVSAEFVANMEDVLDLYEKPHDPPTSGGLL